VRSVRNSPKRTSFVEEDTLFAGVPCETRAFRQVGEERARLARLRSAVRTANSQISKERTPSHRVDTTIAQAEMAMRQHSIFLYACTVTLGRYPESFGRHLCLIFTFVYGFTACYSEIGSGPTESACNTSH
jgi:hypothetical protein